MKKLLGLLLLVSLIFAPQAVLAGEQLGVYVSPKLIYGLTQMSGVKVNIDADSLRIGNKTDSTFGASVAAGYDFSKQFNLPVRAELEFAGFTEAEAKRSFRDGGDHHKLKQTFNIKTLFVNAYWDIETGTQFTPYVGGGLGLGFVDTKLKYSGEDAYSTWGASTGSRSVTNFAWNVGIGLGYDITENWVLDAGYRFVGLGSVKTKSYDLAGMKIHGKANNLFQHQFSVGVRYVF